MQKSHITCGCPCRPGVLDGSPWAHSTRFPARGCWGSRPEKSGGKLCTSHPPAPGHPRAGFRGSTAILRSWTLCGTDRTDTCEDCICIPYPSSMQARERTIWCTHATAAPISLCTIFFFVCLFTSHTKSRPPWQKAKRTRIKHTRFACGTRARVHCIAPIS